MCASKKSSNTEVREVVLVVDKRDVMVKIYVAGVWKDKQIFSGFRYSTGFKLDAVAAFSKNKIPLKAELLTDKKSIKVDFLRPVSYGKKYIYELQLLLNPSVIRNMGSIKIIDWPKEDLGEIHFLRKAGEIFFSSALGEIKKNSKTGVRSISPSKFSKRLSSHAQNSSGIRIEWGKRPRYEINFTYSIRNSGSQRVADISLQSYVPPNTKFQKARYQFPSNVQKIQDDDLNTLMQAKLGSLEPDKLIVFSFSVQVFPQGNVNNLDAMRARFGDWDQYRSLTIKNSTGEALISPSKYWETKDCDILELVDALRLNADSASEYIKLAFEFVNQKIFYRMNGIRITAAQALKNREGDCSEMSDLFVTLLRANGIPAKIVHGWTIEEKNGQISNNLGNQGHAWCEFFAPSSKGWIQCDPTWGFLTGVCSQHICRQREGLIPDQHAYSISYKGNSRLEVDENIRLAIHN